MKPVHQDKFGVEEGNCFAACIASILELPLADVPNFCVDRKHWLQHCNDWLAKRGLAYIEFKLTGGEVPIWMTDVGHHVISGPSPRGDFHHCVVGLDGKMVHDPHPSGAGLKTFDSKYIYFGVFVSRKPYLLPVKE